MAQVAREVGGTYARKSGPGDNDANRNYMDVMEQPIEEKARRIRAILEEGERLADLAEQSGLSQGESHH